jgi:hypothetical protein
MRDAYFAKDRDALSNLANEVIPEVIARIEKLRENHRELWFERNQAFGLDSIERRYGGVLIRLNTAIYRLKKYLNGEIDSIEELEEPRLPATRKSTHVAYQQGYSSIVSAFN